LPTFYPSIQGDVGEGSVAVVPVENVRPKVVEVKVRMAVVVVVPDANPKPVSGVAHARRLGHVGELPVPVIPVEGVPGRWGGGGSSRKWGAIEKVEIDIAIIVVVERRQSCGHGFDNEPAPGTPVGVTKGDACLVSDVGELDGGGEVGSVGEDGGREGGCDEESGMGPRHDTGGCHEALTPALSHGRERGNSLRGFRRVAHGVRWSGLQLLDR
jgi:hypothetical protein